MDDLQRLVEIENIRQLKARYCQTLDKKQWDDYGDVFTEDSVMTMGDVRAEGRAGIVGFVRGELEHILTSHNAHSPILQVTSDSTADGSWSAYYVQEGGKLSGWGFYTEEYRKCPDGAWRISRTHLDTTFFTGSAIPEHAVVEH